MENSILYDKIAVSEKNNFFPKLSFKYYIGFFSFHSCDNVTNTR